MVTKIGYAVSLEKTHPSEAVADAQFAQTHGFDGTLATDHFQPWLPKQGNSSFVWSVLTAIAERTAGNFGPGMAVPGYRYHPATLAQAASTLEAMYPGRHWVGIGSGEAINEHVVASYWPEASERVNRMFEAVDLIKKLFKASIANKDMRYSGEYFKMETGRLWTVPEVAPPILIATSGPLTARRAGKVADGIIVSSSTFEKAQYILQRFTAGAREANRDVTKLKKVLHLYVSWAPTHEQARLQALEEWPIAAMQFPKGDIRSPHVLEQMARMTRIEDIDDAIFISADLAAHREYLQRYCDAGFDQIYMHNVSADQSEWLRAFGAEVLPYIRP